MWQSLKKSHHQREQKVTRVHCSHGFHVCVRESRTNSSLHFAWSFVFNVCEYLKNVFQIACSKSFVVGKKFKQPTKDIVFVRIFPPSGRCFNEIVAYSCMSFRNTLYEEFIFHRNFCSQTDACVYWRQRLLTAISTWIFFIDIVTVYR